MMSQPLFPDDSFPPGRNARCFCGSGARFKHCCGARADDRSPPFGLSIAEDFLSPRECNEIVRLAEATPGKPFTMLDGNGNRTPDEHRVAEWMDCRESGQQLLNDVVARAFEEQIIPRTGQSIDWFEEPQLLRYTTGGFYFYHSDAYQFIMEERAWRKTVDRDISMLLYVNDEYEGGELEFKRLLYTLRPRAGMLVWFPSDVRYEHMAKPVTRGRRYALASWAAASGVQRVQAQRAKRSILWEARENKKRAFE